MAETAFLAQYQLLARYNRWFNGCLYDACERLSDEERRRDRGAFFGSLHRTLAHVLHTDQIWLRRFVQQGESFRSLPPELLAVPEGSSYTSDLHSDWEGLRLARAALDAAIEAWLTEMQPEFLSSAMRYANLKGVQRDHPAWMALTHLFNHQTHHRGQATTLLTQAGIDVGVTDLISRV